MTWFQGLQCALATFAFGLICWRLRALLASAALDAAPFARVLGDDLRAGRTSEALRVARALEPAAAARLACAALGELEQGGDARGQLEQTHAELRAALLRGRDEILTLGRMASPLALIGVIVELADASGRLPRALTSPHAERAAAALERATLAFALGMATLAVCACAASLIQRRALGVWRDLDRIAAVFDGSTRSDPM